MTGGNDSTFKGPTCAKCGCEIGGSWISEGHLSYHPNCAPSNQQPDPAPVCCPTWDTEKAMVINRLATALGICGSITLDELLEQVEKKLKQGDDFRQRFTRLANAVNRGYEVPEVIEMTIVKRLKDWDAGRGNPCC